MKLPVGGARRSSSTAGAGDGRQDQQRVLSPSLSVGSREQEPGGAVGMGMGVSPKGDVLAPAARVPGPNRKFLDKYRLSKMGLFAP